ncbi:hypothetical protein PV729_40750 [Streptomyces europaeiscabiei]|uniref:Uncharacterized protein n=1 Tax=Streptomyces europaeiscabiei TaxID=146819 RepID=A0ABU4NWG9_9ACTN|nr:hypothetical protein [Streptomyces europaeiscabiei]MDX3549652.1 hypothetical protein [Streptomyces europaeiscabiei]MDX3557979.1 hypothetical protein [Streptomyces europaeiscabiei]MDX3706941.1 hypothetical protein [Streptomyces europaeiscabiei]
MPHRDPPGIIAPHIPADDWRRAEATGHTVVIVVQSTDSNGIPWRRVLIALGVAGATAVGTWGLVVALCTLLDATAHALTAIATAAGPIGVGGITFRLARSKNT